MSGNIDTQAPTQNSGPDWKALLQESHFLVQSGRIIDALNALEEAERSVKSCKGTDEYDQDLILGRILNNKGIALKEMKEWDKSAECYEQALMHLSKSNSDTIRERIGVEINRAVLRTRRHQKDKAIESFEKAEKLASHFKGREYDELMSKILMNKAQLHVQFKEMEQAREILDRIATFYSGTGDPQKRKEIKARLTAQLGQWVVKFAEKEGNINSPEYIRQGVKFFEEAGNDFNELGIWRNSLAQMLNRAEALISIKCYDDAKKSLEHVIKISEERGEHSLRCSALAIWLKMALVKKDLTQAEKLLTDALKASDELPQTAREDFIENLITELRLKGCEGLIEIIDRHRRDRGGMPEA